MLCDSSNMRFLESSQSQRQKVDCGARGWGGGGELAFPGDRGSVGGDAESGADGGDDCTAVSVSLALTALKNG